MRILKFVAVLLIGCSAAQSYAADLLTIGSDAPALDVEHWVQNGNGKFKPVTKFETGKVYVVEFWATWCGPCIQSMPHLASLQKEYAEKGVQIVSISDEDLETVEGFLEREVRGSDEENKQTYRDLTSAYCLTTDPDQSANRDYMEAAAQNGIPTAFIVGKDAKVEWIGHPMEMDSPLAAVVEDKWDRESFAKEVKAKQEADKAMQNVMAKMQEQDFEGALVLLDEVLKTNKTNMQLNMMKLQIMVMSKQMEPANEFLGSWFDNIADDPMATNALAWQIYEFTAQGAIEKGEIQTTAANAAKVAVEKSPAEEKASVMDTVAHLLFVSDKLDEAIALETEALKITGERDREFIENFLKELQAAKKPAEIKDTGDNGENK